MSDQQSTQRLGSGDDQDLTRPLSVYEDRDYTQRLETPLAPPWDPHDLQLDRDWDDQDERGSREDKRKWPTSLVVVVGLIGLLLGILGTLVAISPMSNEIRRLRDRVAVAEREIDARDRRIAELEQQLDEERNRPIPRLPLPDIADVPLPEFDTVPLPDIQIPDLADVPLPGTDPSRELLGPLWGDIQELLDQDVTSSSSG